MSKKSKKSKSLKSSHDQPDEENARTYHLKNESMLDDIYKSVMSFEDRKYNNSYFRPNNYYLCDVLFSNMYRSETIKTGQHSLTFESDDELDRFSITVHNFHCKYLSNEHKGKMWGNGYYGVTVGDIMKIYSYTNPSYKEPKVKAFVDIFKKIPVHVDYKNSKTLGYYFYGCKLYTRDTKIRGPKDLASFIVNISDSGVYHIIRKLDEKKSKHNTRKIIAQQVCDVIFQTASNELIRSIYNMTNFKGKPLFEEDKPRNNIIQFEEPVNTRRLMEILEEEGVELFRWLGYAKAKTFFKRKNVKPTTNPKFKEIIISSARQFPETYDHNAIHLVKWTQFDRKNDTSTLTEKLDKIHSRTIISKRYRNNPEKYKKDIEQGTKWYKMGDVSNKDYGYKGNNRGKKSFKDKKKQAFRNMMKHGNY